MLMPNGSVLRTAEAQWIFFYTYTFSMGKGEAGSAQFALRLDA
jgi:hypothetical protein